MIYREGDVPVQSLQSPSHSLLHSSENPSLRRFQLAPSERSRGNRDFVLRYRLTGDAIQSGLCLFDSGGEKLFRLQV
jgi:Ca-activated chloride channel family protein